MGLRRRNLVIWHQSGRTYQPPRARRPSRARRIGWLIRVGMLLSLLRLTRAIRARWRPLLAGTVLTVIGVVFRTNIVGGATLLPGIVLLLCSPLMSVPEPRTKLECELAAYVTRAQRFDLVARLNQYPDDVTQELRDILASCR